MLQGAKQRCQTEQHQSPDDDLSSGDAAYKGCNIWLRGEHDADEYACEESDREDRLNDTVTSRLCCREKGHAEQAEP